MNSLENKIVLITGASSGIGEACAREFAKLKANLLLAARRESRLEKLVHDLKKEFNIKVKYLVVDVRNFDDVQNNFNKLDSEWKNVDILVNNAGLAKGLSKFFEGELKDWD